MPNRGCATDRVAGAELLEDRRSRRFQLYEIDSVFGKILVMKYDPTISLGDPWSYFSFETNEAPARGYIETTFGFKRSETPFGPSILFPHWFPIFLLALRAGIPWLRWRFHLRPLLVATTLVAVVLGLIVAVLRWPAG